MLCMFSFAILFCSYPNNFFFFQRCTFWRLEWEQFQASLGPTYQLHIISSDFFNAVFGKTVNETLANYKEFCSHMRKAKLKLKPSKCA